MPGKLKLFLINAEFWILCLGQSGNCKLLPICYSHVVFHAETRSRLNVICDFILSGKQPTRDLLLFLQALGKNYIDFLAVILVFVSWCQCQQHCLPFCCSDPKMFLLVWAFWNSYERPLVWEALPLVAWKPGRETESWGLHWKCIQFWRNDLAVYNKINYNQH